MKDNAPGMTLIVKTITRLTVGLIMIYGVYIVAQGETTPGSGFAGGVIIALSFIHVMLAYGKEVAVKKIDVRRGLLLAGSGASAFLTFVALGIFGGARRTGPPLLLAECAIAVMVGAGIFVIFLALVLLVEDVSKRR